MTRSPGWRDGTSARGVADPKLGDVALVVRVVRTAEDRAPEPPRNPRDPWPAPHRPPYPGRSKRASIAEASRRHSNTSAGISAMNREPGSCWGVPHEVRTAARVR